MNPILDLWDYRRRVEEIYRSVRLDPDPERAWRHWVRARDELFRTHPQSAIAEERRATFEGISYYDYDPAWRLLATFMPDERGRCELDNSTVGTTTFDCFGVLEAEGPDGPIRLSLFWLAGYGGGVFVPFRDATNGTGTYGGGRYLLDTVKGADLGRVGDTVVLDFNFAYHPSCAHDPRWTCPLSPPQNRLDFPVMAGERLTQER